MPRLTRFLRLERPRPERGRGEGAAVAGGGTGAALERFGPEPAPALELYRTQEGERPFTRCIRCGTDHHRFATECTHCGARLDTEEQREHDERLWAARREEAAREAAGAAQREAARAAGGAATRRELAELLAREVGERERRRLDVELGWGGWAVRLLDALLSPRGRGRR